jgi:rhomboid family GlyGly-CTERM serine protease
MQLNRRSGCAPLRQPRIVTTIFPLPARSESQHASLCWRQRLHNARFELIFALIILAANAPLLWGGSTRALAFFPHEVAAGEWWRVITHAFVHVSWYHLLLDGAAFALLCAELRHWSVRARLVAIGFSAAGSLAAALAAPEIASLGFCGLSGVAHGLMAISAIEMIRRRDVRERRIGWCALIIVLAKAMVEATTGNVALSFLHFGMMGVPIAASHAGGVIGGLVALVIISRTRAAAVGAKTLHST